MASPSHCLELNHNHGEMHNLGSPRYRPHLTNDQDALMKMALRTVRENTGTPYPCTQKELDTYVKRPAPRSQPPISQREATRILEDFNDLNRKSTPEEKAAHRRLAAGMKIKKWGPDLVIKSFRDLDITFFKAKLFGHCNVKWMEDIPGIPCLGCTGHFPDRTLRAWIHLNARLNLASDHEPYNAMWSTLMHEMVVSSLPYP